MRNLLLAALMVVLPFASYAQVNVTQSNPGSGGTGINNALNTSNSSNNTNTNTATGGAGGSGGAGGNGFGGTGGTAASRAFSGATATGGPATGGTASSGTATGNNLTVNGAGAAGSNNTTIKDRLQAPAIAAPSSYSANTCVGAATVLGGSAIGGGGTAAFGEYDNVCRAMMSRGDDVAMETLCLASDRYRLARKHMALLGRAEPCYDDRVEVANARSRAAASDPNVMQVQTASATPVALAPAKPVQPALPDYCAAYGAGSVPPVECTR